MTEANMPPRSQDVREALGLLLDALADQNREFPRSLRVRDAETRARELLGKPPICPTCRQPMKEDQ